MGLRDLLGGRSGERSRGGSRGSALVIRSQPVANVEEAGVRANEQVVHNELWALNIGKRPHHLTLEVRFPGREPFETEVRVQVPARFCRGPSLSLPDGIELPVTRSGPADDAIEIDWKAFGSAPGAKAELKRVGARSHNAAVRAELERTQPELQAKQRDSNAEVITVWTAQVQAGALKRKDFDQSCRTLITLGQLDPALYEAAVRELDGG